jgi:hypothetical protein
MAVPLLHSLTPLLLLAAVSVAHAAAPPPAGAGSDSLDAACNSMLQQNTCDRVLRTIPEASTASPRRLAVLAFQYLLKEGAALSTETESAMKKPESDPCLHIADGNIKRYLGFLSTMAPEQSDAKFAEARDKLSQFVMYPYGTATCSRHVDEPAIKKVLEYEDMLDVTAELLSNAMPAPPEASTDDEDA